MTEEELRRWQAEISADPVNADISSLDPAEYKFLDLYRQLIVEYKQGVDAGDGIRNHDYWDAHVAWFVTKNLTVVAAFAETGDKDRFYSHGSTKKLGVGSGAGFSVQYQF